MQLVMITHMMKIVKNKYNAVLYDSRYSLMS
jgi:hypothetical protein